MQKRHSDRQLYFKELAQTCEQFFIPYISKYKTITPATRILEIGCGDGGNLLPFAKRGCKLYGVDIAECRIEDAKKFFANENAEATFIASDVFLLTELHHSFDLIICHDVIEHINDKRTFLSLLHNFLAEDGIIFMSFPAWQMPFGGHQQICKSKLISHLPYLHLLPVSLYQWILKQVGESKDCIRELLDIKRTKCPIELFERCCHQSGNLHIKNRELYFINPHYKTKFGLTPRRLYKVIANLPYIRNFFTTSCFYTLERKCEL